VNEGNGSCTLTIVLVFKEISLSLLATKLFIHKRTTPLRIFISVPEALASISYLSYYSQIAAIVKKNIFLSDNFVASQQSNVIS